MTDWAAEGAELLEKEADYLCSRCDLKCERWRWPDKEDEWFSCPCCRCRIRTPEQIQATAQRRMAELGEQAAGDHAKLEVVEIPGDVEWEIEEYDGLEWVAEAHRTWR